MNKGKERRGGGMGDWCPSFNEEGEKKKNLYQICGILVDALIEQAQNLLHVTIISGT